MDSIGIAQKAAGIARKSLVIARKSLVELWREPLFLGLLLFFSMALVGFYYLAFGQTESGLATYLTVLVMNEDTGAAEPGGGHWQAGDEWGIAGIIAFRLGTALFLCLLYFALGVMVFPRLQMRDKVQPRGDGRIPEFLAPDTVCGDL
jgi:hypothetical protein